MGRISENGRGILEKQGRDTEKNGNPLENIIDGSNNSVENIIGGSSDEKAQKDALCYQQEKAMVVNHQQVDE